MLLIPKLKSSDINDMTEYSELDRRIIIYSSTVNLDPNIRYSFSLMNVSVQNGSVGALQSRNDLLYTMNMYYGTIQFPFIYRPDMSPEINMEAEVRIKDFGFAHKIVNRFTDTCDTTNHIFWMTNGHCAKFTEQDSEDDNNLIVPSDPRFYNLDHQILVTEDDGGFYTESGLEIGRDMLADDNYGIGYRLRELIDKHTHIYVSKISISDPYKMIRSDPSLTDFINEILCNIQCIGLLTLAKSYNIILDKELGYNILNLKRVFKKMDKQNEIYEIAHFYDTIKNEYEKLLDSNYNIRITIVFNNSQTNVSIIPLKTNTAILNNQISDVTMYEYSVDTLVNQ